MRNKKNVIIVSMIAAVLVMVIVFAALQTRLSISGTSNITGVWNIEITNITSSATGAAYELETPSYAGTNAVINTGLRKPGDKMVYTITVRNSGTVDAIIQEIDITTEGSSAIVYDVDGIQSETRLAKNESLDFTLSVEFDSAATSIPSDNTKEINIDIIAIQDDGQTLNPSDPTVDQQLFLSTKILKNNETKSESGINVGAAVTESNGNGLFYTSSNTEDNKKTYYFRGDVENNYVSFGTYGQSFSYYNTNTGGYVNYNAGDPMIWRIVRINEDGSVRLILQNSVTNSSYNDYLGDNAQVGYMHGNFNYSNLSSSYKEAHQNIINSSIKNSLDNWYDNNLINYSSYLADAGFCNDRSTASSPDAWAPGDTAKGYGENITYYGVYQRTSDITPRFSCPQTSDLFTMTTSDKGNKKLTRPIGLLTIDEYMYAGIGDSYLNNDEEWWTMSPNSFDGGIGDAYYISSYYSIVDTGMQAGVRPVINVKGTIEVSSGDGSVDNPYVIQTTETNTLVSKILANNNEQSDSSIDFSQISSSTNGQGLYYTNTNTEANATTYYFRGNVENNYVSFGTYTEGYSYTSSSGETTTVAAGDPIIWRIVRINEDGSIRLVKQDGVLKNVFNSNPDDNAYVGYMYGTTGASTYALTHTNTTNSTIKGTLDTWYTTHLSSYSSLFATDAGFCNDRSIATSANTWASDDTALGYGTNYTYYGSYNRIKNNSPQFACPNESNDLFTLTTSSKGNKKLTSPIGLLTLDEVVYAGGKTGTSNSNYYLANDDDWWTMSPSNVKNAPYSNMYCVLPSPSGQISAFPVIAEVGVYPVINLKTDVEAVLESTGEPGSATNPYVIKTN